MNTGVVDARVRDGIPVHVRVGRKESGLGHLRVWVEATASTQTGRVDTTSEQAGDRFGARPAQNYATG